MSVYQICIISLLFLLLLTTPFNIQCSHLVPIYSNKTHIIKAITAIFKSDPIQNIGNINIYGYNNETVRYNFTDMLTDLARDLCVTTCYIHWHKPVILHQYEHSNLVLVDTFRSLRYLYETLLKIGTRNLAYTLVYISSLQNPQHASLQNVFQHFYSGSIINVGFILELQNMDLMMVSYNPFGLNACHFASPFILNTYQWQQQRWLSTDFFPPKLKDFQQCLITCATWQGYPYLWFSYDSAGKFAGYEGIEGKLLEFLGDTLNISIGLYEMNEKERIEAFHLTGWVFKEILQTAHFAIGGFYSKPDEYNVFPYSQSECYFMSSINFVVTVMRELSSYEKYTLPFSEFVWYLTILTVMLGVLVIFVSRFGRREQQNFILGPDSRNRAAYYKLITLALGGNYGHSELPRRNFARFLLILWFLATLVLRSSYQSGIYQLLSTDKQRNPPSSLEEIVEQDYTMETHTDNKDVVENFFNVDKLKFRYFNISQLKELERMATLTIEDERKIAMLVPQEHYGFFRKLSPINKEVHVSLFLVGQRLFTKQLVFYVRKNSYLVQLINQQFENAHNYGFLQKWIRMYLDERITGEVNAEGGDEDKPLNFQQLQNIFEILLWFLLVSTGVFGLELFYENYSRRLRCKFVFKTRPR